MSFCNFQDKQENKDDKKIDNDEKNKSIKYSTESPSIKEETTKNASENMAASTNGQVLDYNKIDITVEHDNTITTFSMNMAQKIMIEAKMESRNSFVKDNGK